MADDRQRHGIGLAVKFGIVASLLAAIFCAVAIWATHSSMYEFIKESAGRDQKKMAELMAASVIRSIDDNLAGEGRDKGAYFGEVLLDDSTGAWVLPINVSLLDKTGSLTESVKRQFPIDVLFDTLAKFKIGETGHAALVDGRTYLIFAPGAKPFVNKFSSYNELERLLYERSGWSVMEGVYGHRGKVFVAFCRLDHPLFMKKGIKWWVFVVRDAKEVFEPLERLLRYEMVASLILVLLIGMAGLVLGRFITRPVRRLEDGLTHLGSGDFKYRVAVDSKDELGGLEDSFNKMADKLSDTTVSKVDLDVESDRRRKAEEKVKQLAQELQKTFDTIKTVHSDSESLVGGKMKDFIKTADKLMDLSRIEGDKIELDIKNIDMRDLIKKSVFYFEHKIREKNLDLRLDVPKVSMNAQADSARIKQVLSILLNNAVRFTEKGYVAIIAKEYDNNVECSVLNTGLAMPQNVISGLFDDLHNMNLSIAKGIIEKHKGSIWVESEQDKPTKFSFKIPKNPSK